MFEKILKMRLTVMLCVNEDGSVKLTQFSVRLKKSRCFKDVKSFLKCYDANKKAWTTRDIFKKIGQKNGSTIA